jgi:hypothetical protein
MKKILFSALLLVSASTHAAISGTAVTKVSFMQSYNQYGGGDTTFQVETPLAGCENGFWMSKSDAGFNTNLALILSAYHAKSSVIVYALTDQIWGGSAGKYCKLYMIELR